MVNGSSSQLGCVAERAVFKSLHVSHVGPVFAHLAEPQLWAQLRLPTGYTYGELHVARSTHKGPWYVGERGVKEGCEGVDESCHSQWQQAIHHPRSHNHYKYVGPLFTSQKSLHCRMGKQYALILCPLVDGWGLKEGGVTSLPGGNSSVLLKMYRVNISNDSWS